MNVREELQECYHEPLLFADNFDAAIIGVSIGCDSGRVVYSTKKMAEVLVQNDDMSYEEAWEFLEFNTFCAYVGENTPIYVECSR